VAGTTATRFLRLIFAITLASVALGGLSASAAPTTTAADPYRILLSSNRDGKTRAYSMLPDGSGLTPLLRPALEPLAVSRDGRMIAYQDRRYALYASRADGSSLRRVAPQTDGVAAFSPNGKLLAFAASVGIKVVDMDGRILLRVKAEGTGLDYDWDWSPDGTAIVLGAQIDDRERYALIVQPLRGKRRVLVHTGPSEENGAGVDEVQWSLDGKWIAYVNGENAERRNGVWLIRPNGKGLHRVAPGPVSSPTWSRDGGWIAYARLDDWEGGSARELWLVQPTGQRSHRVAVASNLWRFAWSPNGKALAFAADSDVAVVDLGGRISWRLHRDQAAPSLTWSPDGRRLALADLYLPTQISVVDSDGSGLQRLTSEGNNALVGWTRLAPTLPPAAPVPPSEQVLDAATVATRAPVSLLSADGPRVAFLRNATATDCDRVEVWMPGGESVQRFGGLAAPCGHGQRFLELALAGDRVAWVLGDTGCDHNDYTLQSATLAEPSPLEVADCLGCAKPSAFAGFHLHGHGDLLVFDGLVRIGAGSEKCPGTFSTTSICTTLRSGADATPVDSVSGGLIAIRKPGAVTVLDAQGKLVRAFSFAPADVSAALLDGGRLVVWRFGVLEVYDVATGARELSGPLPIGYRPVDVDGGIVLLRQGDTIMLLRLSDGRSLTLTPGRAPVLADLESAGLYYSYATADGGGRVVFVPRSDLLQQLGGGS